MVYDGDDDDAIAAGCAQSWGTTKAFFGCIIGIWKVFGSVVSAASMVMEGVELLFNQLFVLVFWHFSGWQIMVCKGHAFDVGIL